MNEYLKISKYWCNACVCVTECVYIRCVQVPTEMRRSPGVTGGSEPPNPPPTWAGGTYEDSLESRIT